MRARDRQRQQLGNYYLWRRPPAGTWCICWLERRGDGTARTRRKTTGIGGGDEGNPPQAAVDALAAHHLTNKRKQKQRNDEALVEDLIAGWLSYHVCNLAAPDRYVISVQHWLNFFDAERRVGRIGAGVTAADLSPDLVARFHTWRREAGVGGHTISRDLAAIRGAMTWAWKNQLIEHVPYIADVPLHQKAKARDRVMTFDEIGRMLDLCIDRPDREHLVRFIVLALGTAGRPQAILEVAQKDVNLTDNLIDLSGGKAHPRKRRPIVPIAEHVRPWIEGLEGKLIRYRIPIAEKNLVPDGPTHFERETRSIKTVWNTVCHEAAIEGATPKTLRHTMLTWLAKRGVPAEQRQMLAGHSPQGTTARNYEHLSPDYLQAAIEEVDAFFGKLAQHTKVPLRYTYDTPHRERLAA